MKKIVELTIEATQYLQEKIVENDALGVNIDVVSGGCSGMQYKFSYAKEVLINYEKIDFDNFFVQVNMNALVFVAGSTLHLQKTAISSKLVFINDREKSKCGCGQSFNV